MKNIVFTHSINSIISKFTSLFLAIYLLKITDGNIVTVISYYLIKYSCTIPFSYLTLKMIRSNNVLNLYRLGLFSNGICLIVLLLLGGNIKEYVFAFAILDSFTSLLYWSPYKMILYNFQKDNELKNIFSANSIVTSFIQIVSTIGMGYLITNASYNIVFIIIFILTIIAMLVTFRFDKYKFEVQMLKFKNLKNLIKDKRTIKISKIVFLEGMGYRGGLDTAITLLIFFAVGSESVLGNYSSIFALVGLVTAILVKKYLNKENKKKAFIISSILIIISTIPIIMFNSFILFVIYNIVFNMAYKITQIIVDSEVFSISGNKLIEKYKVEYTYLTEAWHALGKVLSEILLLIVTIFFFNYHNYQIVVAILSLSILLQSLIYKKE